jgi:uncharacterized DUF497 family protein
MGIIWNEEKDKKLQIERGLSFDTISELILQKKFTAVLENPSRDGQMIFIIPWNNYTYVVPFVVDDEQNIVLKTIFPSRKYHKLYGGKNEN